VQGVGYRESMRIEAERLGATGWVRNRLDGSVEAFVQGEEIVVAQVLEWARQGPRAARVDAVEVEDQALDPAIQGFSRRPTESLFEK
jgi:acylphosphatase